MRNGNNKPEVGLPVAISIAILTIMAMTMMFGASSQEAFEAREEAKRVADPTWVVVDKRLSKDCEGVLVTFAVVSDTTQRWSRIIDRLHEEFSDFASVKLGEVVKFEVSSRALSGNPHDMVSYLKPRRM